MSLTISPSPFGSLVVSVAETGSTLSVTTVATSPSVLTMALGVPGPAGEQGEPGANGVGVAAGGLTNQVLVKLSNADYDTGWANGGAGGDYLPLTGGTLTGNLVINTGLGSEGHYETTEMYVTRTDATGTSANAYGALYNGGLEIGDSAGNWAELTTAHLRFGDGTIQTTAGLPLTGGTMTGNIALTTGGDLSNTISESNIYILDTNSANYANLTNDNLTFHSDSGSADGADYGAGGFNIGGGLLVGTNSGITFPDSSVQSTAWLGYNGTTSEYIRGDGSLYTFPPVGDRYLTSSTSTLTVDSGNGKTMTVGTGLSYSPQQDITVSYNTANHMHGTVLTYNSATGVMTFDSNTHSGSGTYSSWEVNVGGVAGAILPVGGTAGQILAKINSTNFNTEWISLGSMAQATTTDYLAKADNLSGLASTSTARTNLGLGTMATATASDYLAKAGNLSGLASASTSRTNLGLGTMAVETATDYLAKADNLSGLASASTARTNLGLGTAATQTTATFLQTANNLSDVTASTARTNLGLGAVATDAYATTAQAQAGTSTTTVINPSTLLDAKYFQGGKSAVQFTWSTSVSGTGASASAQNANARLNAGPTSATGYAIASAVIANNSRGTIFNSGFDFSKRVQFGLRVARNVASPDTNSVFRYSIGKSSGTDASDLSARGLMIKVAGTGALQLLVHNGTTLTTTTSSYTPSNGVSYDVSVVSDGSGNVTLYVNGSSVATSTGGPTSAGATNANYLMFEIQNTATLSASAMNIAISDYYVQVNS